MASVFLARAVEAVAAGEQTAFRGPAGLQEIRKRLLRGGSGMPFLEAFTNQMGTLLSELGRLLYFLMNTQKIAVKYSCQPLNFVENMLCAS